MRDRHYKYTIYVWYAALLFTAAAMAACKTTNRTADIISLGEACMANVVAEHKAGRLTNQAAEYGLAKCEAEANTQAQLRYLTARPR